MLFTMSDSISAAPDADRRDDHKTQKHKSINQYSVRIQNEPKMPTIQAMHVPNTKKPQNERPRVYCPRHSLKQTDENSRFGPAATLLSSVRENVIKALAKKIARAAAIGPTMKTLPVHKDSAPSRRTRPSGPVLQTDEKRDHGASEQHQNVSKD